MYEMNILPKRMRKRKKKIKFSNPTYAPFLLGLVFFATILLNSQLDNKLKEVNEQIDSLIVDINSISIQLDTISSLEQEANSINSEINTLMSQINSNLYWPDILNEISAVIPPEVTITKIKNSEGHAIELTGETTKLFYMAKLKLALDENPYFNNVQLDYTYAGSNVIERNTKVSFTIRTLFSKNSDNIGGEN